MSRLAESVDQLREDAGGRGEETGLGSTSAEHEKPRPQPVAERLGVSLDETVLGKRSQRT